MMTESISKPISFFALAFGTGTKRSVSREFEITSIRESAKSLLFPAHFAIHLLGVTIVKSIPLKYSSLSFNIAAGKS